MLPDTYYEDEVREGFFIPSIMKKAWAANLSVFAEVDRICQKYGITYYAAYGTLLGAVRHKGFIPWDDDLDIMMKREDYDRFLEVVEKEFPERYTIINTQNTDHFWNFLSRIATSKHMCFDEDYLIQYHGFPYMTGLDIFILDNLSSDQKQEEQRDVLINYMLAVADKLEEKGIDPLKTQLAEIERLCGITLDYELSPYELRRRIYAHIVELCKAFQEDETGNLGRLMPDVLVHKGKGFPRKYFEQKLVLPFEGMYIPVPIMYHKCLELNYGNYIQVVQGMAGHDYPFIEKQKKQFEDVWGQKFPEYHYTGTEMLERPRTNSYKDYVMEYLESIERLLQVLKDNEGEKNDWVDRQDHLAQAQNLAIELGNFIEEIRGEGTKTEEKLMILCEQIYEAYRICGVEDTSGWQESVLALDSILKQVRIICKQEIIEHKTVVFMPFHAKHWKYMKEAYEKECREADTDVSVIPIPYYYKQYDGTLVKEIFDISEYPQDLPLLDHKDYDWELQHPDKLYIQYPYDSWNSETVIAPEYYSDQLRLYTDELIYIPYFRVRDFTEALERDYHNMKYYCTMPAVVNADKVILHSEQLKKMYVKKLTEFAGEETGKLWEDKIEVWDQQEQTTERKKQKKVLLYFVSFTQLVQHRDTMIAKMESVLRTFEESKERIQVLWREDDILACNQSMIDVVLYQKYQKLVEHFVDANIGVYRTARDGVGEEDLVEECDAFYGDHSRYAYLFSCVKKPVMLANIELV